MLSICAEDLALCGKITKITQTTCLERGSLKGSGNTVVGLYVSS